MWWVNLSNDEIPETPIHHLQVVYTKREGEEVKVLVKPSYRAVWTREEARKRLTPSHKSNHSTDLDNLWESLA